MIIQAAIDTRNWAVTTTIANLKMTPGNLHIEFDKQATWPTVDIGGGVQQQATLWVFLFINGTWYATGAERLLPGQQNKMEDNLYSNWIKRWLHDFKRWGPMANHVPAVGARVGFMVTNGSLKSDSQWVVAERSDVYWINWPADGVPL